MLKGTILSDQQTDQIIENGLRILEEIGVDVNSSLCLGIFEKLGCKIDGKRVRIPQSVAMHAVETAPSYVKVYDRLGNEAMNLGGTNSYYGSGPTCPNFFDPRTGKRRPAIKQDAADAALVADALQNIDFVMSLCMIGDTVKGSADFHEVDAMLRNTTKPIATWAFDVPNTQAIIDLCAAAAGGLQNFRDKPFLLLYTEPVTPLVHNSHAIDAVTLLAENNIPSIYTPGMVLGATAPTTIAGSMSVGIAECLTGLVAHQYTVPGAPFIGGCAGSPLDMRTMQPPYGAPENMLIHAASSEVWRKLGIPSFGLAGASDAKTLDAQTGFETALSIILSGICGSNLIHDVGFMDFGLTGSVKTLVFCNEVIGHARRLMAGIEVDEEHLAYNAVLAEGPGGNFIKSRHTRKHFRQENWIPEISDRLTYSAWEEQGQKTIDQFTQEKLIEILDTHKPVTLDPAILSELDRIVIREEQRISGNK